MKKDRDFREKSDAARRGKGFVGQRGGNETLTPQQIALAEATAIRLRTGLQALQSAGFTSSMPGMIRTCNLRLRKLRNMVEDERRDQEHLEGSRPVDTLYSIQFDVRGG